MKPWNKLTDSPRQFFWLASVSLFLLFGALFTPLIGARFFGTPVTLRYQSSYVEPGMTVYPALSIERIAKDQLPCTLSSIYFYSETPEEAYEKLDDVGEFYVVLEEIDGLHQIQNVLTSRPTEGLYLTANWISLEYSDKFIEDAVVWQDSYYGMRISYANNIQLYIDDNVTQAEKNAILDGTATLSGYVWNGKLYLLEFDL